MCLHDAASDAASDAFVRIVVTGGAGFIGSHVVDLLVVEGHDVIVVDALLPKAHAERPPYLNERATYVEADLRDRDALEEAVAGADAVSHQASLVGLGESWLDVTDYVAHNDLGTASLLGCLHASGFSGRLVLASSMVVYGEGRYRCEADGLVRPAPRSEADLDDGRFEPLCPRCGHTLIAEAVREDLPVDPRNVYAATKLHQEHLCELFGRATSSSVAWLRYHNVYGPRMPRDTPYAGVASIFRSALERGEAPQVFEDGRQLRDFVHVEDVARANLAALAAPHARGAFNISSGRPRSVHDMVSALSAVFQATSPPDVTGRWRLGDVRHVFGSPTKAERELDWRAAMDFDAGMRDFATQPLRAASS